MKAKRSCALHNVLSSRCRGLGGGRGGGFFHNDNYDMYMTSYILLSVFFHVPKNDSAREILIGAKMKWCSIETGRYSAVWHSS